MTPAFVRCSACDNFLTVEQFEPSSGNISVFYQCWRCDLPNPFATYSTGARSTEPSGSRPATARYS